MAMLFDALLGKLQDLKALARYRARMLRLALTMNPHPIAGGAPAEGEEEGSGEDTGGEDDKSAAAAADGGEEEGSGEDTGGEDDKPAAGTAEPDWKRMARKHEREAKAARKEREALAKQLKEREDADKSEQEKATEEAVKQARGEEQSKFETERRQDRLELATTKIAAKGLKIGSGDDAKTVRFADPDDALVHLERDIRNGDIDTEELFDEHNRVRPGQLEEALTDLLSRKPHLAASDGKPPKVQGGADGGKGEPTDTEPTVADEFKKIRRNSGAGQAPSVMVGRQAG